MDRGMLRLGNRTSNLSCAPSSLCFCISISVTADSPLPPWLCTMQANFLHAFGHGIRDFGDAGCNGHTHTINLIEPYGSYGSTNAYIVLTILR